MFNRAKGVVVIQRTAFVSCYPGEPDHCYPRPFYCESERESVRVNRGIGYWRTHGSSMIPPRSAMREEDKDCCGNASSSCRPSCFKLRQASSFKHRDPPNPLVIHDKKIAPAVSQGESQATLLYGFEKTRISFGERKLRPQNGAEIFKPIWPTNGATGY